MIKATIFFTRYQITKLVVFDFFERTYAIIGPPHHPPLLPLFKKSVRYELIVAITLSIVSSYPT